MKNAKFYESLDDVISETCKKSEFLYIKDTIFCQKGAYR